MKTEMCEKEKGSEGKGSRKRKMLFLKKMIED